MGVDCERMLLMVGINPDALNQSQSYVSSESMEELIALLAEASGDPCFGLHSSNFIQPSSYSVLGYIALNCATPRAIQAKIPIYEKLVGDMGTTSIERRGGYTLQRWDCQFQNPIARRHEIDNVMGSWIKYARRFLSFEACEKVWLEHSAPRSKTLESEYQKTYGCEVLFDQPASGLMLSNHLLDQPLPQADEQMLQVMLDHATKQLADLDSHDSIAHQVKNLLKLMLKRTVPSSEEIAKELGLSNRSLQRKLASENTNFNSLLNELRYELAIHYLKNSQLSLDSIAHELGYSETRSFHRSFKNWAGMTAGTYRKTIR